MSNRVRVPIRVRRPNDGPDPAGEKTKKRAVSEPEPAVVEGGPIAAKDEREVSTMPRPGEEETPESNDMELESLREDVEMWRDRALRLQAEIENFRKRQRRLAEDRIEANRGRLLRNFLGVADDLERALRSDGGDGEALREGVKVTKRSLEQLLRQEGVEPIQAEGERFDPNWHEAVGTVPQDRVDADRDTVVDVTQPGYRLNDRLLRPARVIVAR
jgi:molecular chaperone GrpE